MGMVGVLWVLWGVRVWGVWVLSAVSGTLRVGCGKRGEGGWREWSCWGSNRMPFFFISERKGRHVGGEGGGCNEDGGVGVWVAGRECAGGAEKRSVRYG